MRMPCANQTARTNCTSNLQLNVFFGASTTAYVPSEKSAHACKNVWSCLNCENGLKVRLAEIWCMENVFVKFSWNTKNIFWTWLSTSQHDNTQLAPTTFDSTRQNSLLHSHVSVVPTKQSQPALASNLPNKRQTRTCVKFWKMDGFGQPSICFWNVVGLGWPRRWPSKWNKIIWVDRYKNR